MVHLRPTTRTLNTFISHRIATRKSDNHYRIMFARISSSSLSKCRLVDQTILHYGVGTGVCRGISENSSGAQQETEQQQIKTVQ